MACKGCEERREWLKDKIVKIIPKASKQPPLIKPEFGRHGKLIRK